MALTPAIDVRAFIDDERYHAYRSDLEAKRAKALQRLLSTDDAVRSARLKGEIIAFDEALGTPSVLLRSDQPPTTP